MVSHKDAVYNLSRAALATAAFCEGNYALLGVATKDVLHQKYRLPLIEGGDDIFELAQDLGAQAVYISGAGPTIMAVVHKDDTEFSPAPRRRWRRMARCIIYRASSAGRQCRRSSQLR